VFSFDDERSCDSDNSSFLSADESDYDRVKIVKIVKKVNMKKNVTARSIFGTYLIIAC